MACNACNKNKLGKSTAIDRAKKYYQSTGEHVGVYDNGGGSYIFTIISHITEGVNIEFRTDEDI